MVITTWLSGTVFWYFMLLYVWCTLLLISIAIHMCSNQNMNRPWRELEKPRNCPCFENNPSMLSKSLYFLLFCHVEMQRFRLQVPRRLSTSVWSLFSFINTMYYCLSDFFLSALFADLVFTPIVQYNRWIVLLVYYHIQHAWVNEGNRMHDSPGWKKASVEFKGSLLGICTVKEDLIEYEWSVERWEVLRGLLCSGLQIRPNHPGGIANI